MQNLEAKKKFFGKIEKYTHEHPFVKFLIVLGIFLIYLILTINHFGVENGILVSLLTWSFFVFCTPIADAGVLVDFPIRVLTGIRMLYSEIMVWIIALLINIYARTFEPAIYKKTIILEMFNYILNHPWPYGIIIVLSCIGTFLSVYFGDEILDILTTRKQKRKEYNQHILKHRIIIFLFLIAFVLMFYFFLLQNLKVNIPLF